MRSYSYTEGFVEECLRRGLSMEATTGLLQKDARELEGDSFVAGFNEELDKSSFMRGVMRAGRGAVDALGGLTDAFTGATKSVGTGVKKTVGPGRSLISQFPRSFAAGGALAGGAGIVGGNQLWKSTHNAPNANIVPPGGYDEDRANRNFNETLDAQSTGIYELNKRHQQDPAREAQLKAVVDEGGPDSVMALQELQRMRLIRSTAEKERSQYMSDINSAATASALEASRLREERAGLDGAESSLWRLPQRALLRLTGRDPSQFYNERRTALQQQLEQSNTTEKLLSGQARRLHGGAVGGVSQTAPAPEELQQQFFQP
jgi:hypothetical protein